MSDAKIQIANTTDVLEGTKVTTLAGDNLFREGVVVSDPIVGEARARCLNTTPASNEYGMSVRQVGAVQVGNFPTEYPLSEAQITALKKTPMDDAVNAGILFTAGGRVSVTNNTAVLQLSNPIGSGKTIFIQEFFLAADTNIDFQYIKGGTVNAPTTQTVGNLNLGSVNTAVGIARTGATGIAGGTPFGGPGRLAANITVPFKIPVVLPPGSSVSATFTSTILSQIVCFAAAVWIEV